MQQPIAVTEDVFWVGVNDRRTHLFENLWPLERGMAYNAYVIRGEKTVLLDTVERGFMDEFLGKVDRVLGGRPLDYLVINHMEPDHAGSIGEVVRRYPEVTLVGNAKTFEMLEGFFGIHEHLLEVKDGDILDLGTHRLRFVLTPMVHWPESMMSLEETRGILFSADAFGSFGALEGGLFDDEVDLRVWEGEMRRYYANIVGKYCAMVVRAMQKLVEAPVRMIAPTHGLVFRTHLSWVLDLYRRWSTFDADPAVVVIYGSMYGNTELMADTVARGLKEEGVADVQVLSASRTHLSHLLSEIWRCRGVVLGSCAYNTTCHPPIEALIHKLLLWGAKDRLLGAFGTYSWSGGGVKAIRDFGQKIGWELLEPAVEAKHRPHGKDLTACRDLARVMAGRILAR